MVVEDPLLYEQDCIEEVMSKPVQLNQEDSFELYIQRERIKHHLQNLLSGTREEKVVGELDLAVAIALKNKQEKQVIETLQYTKSADCQILSTIMSQMNFKLVNEGEKHKKAVKLTMQQVPLFVVSKPPTKPMFKCVPNRMMMQRIVNRYTLVVDKMKDPANKMLMPLSRFSRAEYE